MIGKFIPEIPGENVIYPGKKIPRPGPTRNKISRPGPTRNRITRPDPTRKYSLKCSPTPDRFRSGPVRSGETRGFGLPRRSLVWCTKRERRYTCSDTVTAPNWRNVLVFSRDCYCYFTPTFVSSRHMSTNRIKETPTITRSRRVTKVWARAILLTLVTVMATENLRIAADSK